MEGLPVRVAATHTGVIRGDGAAGRRSAVRAALPVFHAAAALPAGVGGRPALRLGGAGPVITDPAGLAKAGAAVGDAAKCAGT